MYFESVLCVVFDKNRAEVDPLTYLLLNKRPWQGKSYTVYILLYSYTLAQAYPVAAPDIFFCRCYGGARRFSEGAMK